MDDARKRYLHQIEVLSSQEKTARNQNRIAIALRPALFLPMVVLLLAAYTREGTPELAKWIGWILFLAFLAALAWHESIRLKVEAIEIQQALYRRLLARLNRDWTQLTAMKLNQEDLQAVSSPECDDLDIFGQRSLFQWFSLASTRVGKRTLSRWLMTWQPPEVIVERQAAVAELRDQHTLREQILFVASRLSDTHANPESFTDWATSPNWLQKHRTTHRLSWLGPGLVVLGSIWVFIARNLEISNLPYIGLGILALGIACNLLLMMGMVGAVHDIFGKINTGHGEVQQYRLLYESIREIQGRSPLIVQLRATCVEGPRSAIAGFQSLRRFVALANLQHNQLFYIPYFILQLAFQWDIRVLEWLERWKVKFGRSAPGWLDALGQWESILSASTLADEYRDWCVPKWSTNDHRTIQIEGLGHPLLKDEHRVGNDLMMDSKQPLLLVTGSNMAGKSTMLRSLGLNIVMARTGAPMCARSYLGPAFELATSIRVNDSVQDGVSFFMAELHRLKDVVDFARHCAEGAIRPTHGETPPASGNSRPVLALLDEILQGTNSRERQIAVLSVVGQLLELGAITAISTHDLELADKPEIVRVAQVVHFREYFEEVDGVERMRFDYLMRPGPTPTTNAVKLLQLVGLGGAPPKSSQVGRPAAKIP